VPGPSSGVPELRTKLLWLSIFRMVATTLMMGALAVRLLSGPGDEFSGQDSLSFGLIGGVYGLSLVYAIWLRRGRANPLAAWVQVSGDVVLATSLVYLTGGADSPFTFAYLIAVVAGAILLHQRGALITAGTSAVAFCGLVLLAQRGLVTLPGQTLPLDSSRLTFVLVSNVLAQMLIAVLAGYLSRQLRTTGGRLSDRESDLRRLAKQQRQILASMPSGLVTSDVRGSVTYINRAGAAILGVSEHDVVGTPVEALLPGLRELGGSARRVVLEMPAPAGHRALGLSVSPMEGDRESLLIVFQDLTDLRRLEDEMKRVDRLATMGRLSAQLAHEIRNPLASMRGAAQLLIPDVASSADQSERLPRILIREADRLSLLLEDFLRFSRPPSPVKRRCSLKSLVAETLEVLQVDPGTASVRLESDLQEVQATVDPDQLRQVLINLLRNAVAAVGQDGTVRVRLEGHDHGAEIRIWDSGGSIPASDLTRIFEPFYTTRQGGTGLGLSTAHSIVHAHGGNLRATSSSSEGTEFVLELPEVSEGNRANPGSG
jgi:two-component system sensor histidine kinase PilS (NtrC family)